MIGQVAEAGEVFESRPLKKGYVVSDLHLFTHRTVAHKQIDAIREAAAGRDFLVLNGDIFDFRWSTYSTRKATAVAAVNLLRRLVEGTNGCRILYVLGNHDRFAPLAARLSDLATEQTTFGWYASYVRIGTCLFLHGDLVFDRACTDPFGNDLDPIHRHRGTMMNVGYRAIVTTRVHRIMHPFYPPRRCARRILGCLHRSHPSLSEGLTDVYFGHTHRTFTDFQCGGVAFHNTGSSVRHIKSRLLPVTA